MSVEGICDSRFARVREAFRSCFADGLEHGGGVAVVAGGKTVVELWGGHADAAGTRPWQRDTLINIWSSTKGVVALAVAILVERGKLNYAAPIARWWPEFAANGKEAITLDLVLSHQAGLNGVTVPIDEAQLCTGERYTAALAEMAPLWAPGSRCIYHGLTYGHLIGEPLRRVDGRSLGRFVADEIAGPLGADLYIGLPEREESRVAEMIEGPRASDWISYVQSTRFPQCCHNPVPRALAPNSRAWRAAEIPGANGQGTAHALARIYGLLAAAGAFEGQRIIGQDAIRASAKPRVRGFDESLGTEAAFAAGYQIEASLEASRAGPTSFGHTGWGGTVGFADPEAGIGFGFVTNRMLGFDGSDPRRDALIGALYDSLR